MSTTQGILAESIFITECLKRDIQINQPINDIYGYDFIIYNGHYLRIQVKSTLHNDKNRSEGVYKIQCRKGANGKAYEGDDFDLLAAYIIPLDIWYLIPISELNKTTIRINVCSRKCKYQAYKGNFSLLKGQTIHSLPQ